MHKVVVERGIGVPVAETWRILDDFGGVHKFHPFVDRSPIDNGVARGLGAERVCHFTNGDQIKERITAYEAGREYTVEIVDPGSFPLRSAAARLLSEDSSGLRTRSPTPLLRRSPPLRPRSDSCRG